jgi:hypothetical protein
MTIYEERQEHFFAEYSCIYLIYKRLRFRKLKGQGESAAVAFYCR